MIKALFKYLLPLSIFLFSGYSQLSAHNYRENASGTSLKLPADNDVVTFGNVPQDLTFIFKAATSGNTKANKKKIIAQYNEVEEDETASFKKFSDSNPYIAAVFYALVFGYLFHYIGKALPSSRHFFHIAACRWHIMLQVFRI